MALGGVVGEASAGYFSYQLRLNPSRLTQALLFLCLLLSGCTLKEQVPIRVGILYLRTGPLADNERAITQSTSLAIEELQARGGLLGRPLEIVLSRESAGLEEFAQEAERLIAEEKVDVLFGCWSSASRKVVLPVLQRHQHLLFYPLQYEGLEQSPYVVYTGAVPNQQLVPAVKWSLDNLGRRVFLVGSDYIYPHIANGIARDQMTALGAEVVGEEYIAFGGTDVTEVIESIRQAKPDVILNTINGDSNLAFFKALKAAGLDGIPTMSTSVAEGEFRQMGVDMPVGHYATWAYFESLDTPGNKDFVERYHQRFGVDKAVTSPMESGYFSVRLWAQAVEAANSVAPAEVRKSVGGQSWAAPEGIVSVDPSNLHTWKSVRVGRLTSDGQFEVQWSSAGPVRPRPYPPYQSKEVWDAKLQSLFEGWGESWIGETAL